MKYHILLLFTLLMMLATLEVSAGDINLLQEYHRLDDAIEQSDSYVQVREERIAKLKTALEVTRAVNAQYDLCHSLYEEYHSYVNDSAIFYLDRCIALAQGTWTSSGMPARPPEFRTERRWWSRKAF